MSPTFSEKIVVVAGRNAAKELRLPAAAVAGRVVDEKGEGVPGVQVAAVLSEMASFRTGEVDDMMRAFGHGNKTRTARPTTGKRLQLRG